jgi:hypothetical protein
MPRTLAQNAQYIAETIKPAIKSAIEAQGVTVPSTDSFLDYADRIGEIEGGGSGYQLKDLPTGAISTVNDAAELPLNALKVSVEAWQEGSGDPSPSNIRPIHGWDSGEITVCQKNRFNKALLSDISSTLQYKTVSIPNGTYTMSTPDFEFVDGIANLFVLAGEQTAGASSQTNGVTKTTPITVTITDKKITYAYCTGSTNPNNPINFNWQLEEGTQATAFAPFNSQIISQQFPTTIYGAEWDVVDGGMNEGYGFVEYDGSADEDWTVVDNGKRLGVRTGLANAKIITDPTFVSTAVSNIYETVSNADTWSGNVEGISLENKRLFVSDGSGNMSVEAFRTALASQPLQVKFPIATPVPISLSPLSIRLNEGVNNLYADCGDVIEGEYFVDEGALDVRKVDYTATTSDYPAITKGRCFSPKYINNMNYVVTPRASDGTWLDVDWTKDFEVQAAFKMLDDSAQLSLFTNGVSNTNNEYSPTIFYTSNNLRVLISSGGGSWDLIYDTNFKPTLDTWYAVKMTYTASTQALVVAISTDFENWTTLMSQTLGFTIQYNGASLIFGGRGADSQYWNPGNIVFDTFNTYIKGDGVNWGAFTGAFPS